VQGYYAADVAMPVFKDIADKVFSTNLDMHKELQRDSAFYSHLPVVKNGLSNPTTRACTETQTLSKNLNDGNEWTLAEKGTQGVNIKPTNFREGIVPNVIGMGLRDAVYLLETRGLQVKVVGRGAVNKQSIATGTKISRGELITIELS
jgi:cell division protein FtsI (penicillin-binding protein 3)